MSKYYLKDHVTDEMLVAVGFEIMHYNQDAYRKNIFIPLIDCKWGKRTIQPRYHFNRFNKDDIKDLIELGYVEEVK